jgi:hypothetical protein
MGWVGERILVLLCRQNLSLERLIAFSYRVALMSETGNQWLLIPAVSMNGWAA